MKSVFISHSSKDKAIADKIVESLEREGLSVWIAPRDIPAGKAYASSILNGIRKCTVFLLIYSESANESEEVLKEVHHAASAKKAIIPYRIDDSVMCDGLSYHLSHLQWVDASTCEDSLSELISYIKDYTCVTMPIVTAQVTDKRNANELAEQMPQSHEDYIRIAKKTGKHWGWAYYQAKKKGFETLNSNEAKRIYDDFESVDLPDKSSVIGDVKDTNDDNSDSMHIFISGTEIMKCSKSGNEWKLLPLEKVEYCPYCAENVYTIDSSEGISGKLFAQAFRGGNVCALENLIKIADLGDAKAQFYLGLLYDCGADVLNVSENNVLATEWYKKAAESGLELI